MRTVYLLSVFLHITSAIIWIGGMTFIMLVLVPVLRRPEFRGVFSKLFHLAGIRFKWIGWTSLCLLIITGMINLNFRGYDFSNLWEGTLFQGDFGHILLQKLIAVSIILLISIVHDFWIGPTATALVRQNPQSAESKKYRKLASWIARINFILALIVVAMGILLVRGL